MKEHTFELVAQATKEDGQFDWDIDDGRPAFDKLPDGQLCVLRYTGTDKAPNIAELELDDVRIRIVAAARTAVS